MLININGVREPYSLQETGINFVHSAHFDISTRSNARGGRKNMIIFFSFSALCELFSYKRARTQCIFASGEALLSLKARRGIKMLSCFSLDADLNMLRL
jgi:hypothetical protein